MFLYHSVAAFVIGFILDLLFGDPYWMPHPIRFIGNLIGASEKVIRKIFDKNDKTLLAGGFILVIWVLLVSTAIPFLLLYLLYHYIPWLGFAAECIMCYQILATKCLKTESMKVYHSLQKQEVEEARYHVSMIVGRDTKVLDETGIIKAAVETVAENTSDGVIAPMIYMAIGGPVLGFFYKAVNTMDSMVGYKNEKYLYFGRCAAKFDDFLNFIPARLSAFMMIAVCPAISLNKKNAKKVYLRDRLKHASPNSAQTEAACAGALQVMLAGDAYYFGKLHKKPTIGDDIRKIEVEDIRKANRLLYATALGMLGVLTVIKIIAIYGINMVF